MRRQVVGALGEPDLREQLERRAARAPPPTGASFASTFSTAVSVGIRLNCWKTKPNERRRSSASCGVAAAAEVAAVEGHRARAGPVERAEDLQERRLARAARALEREELARLDLEARRRRARGRWSGRAGRSARRRSARRGSFDLPQRVGRPEPRGPQRAGRPAISPPRRANPKPIARTDIPTGAVSDDVACRGSNRC